ncbi:MAG: hypothetical protein Q9174_006064 [Haloplaca sp. 1 TL-2023]
MSREEEGYPDDYPEDLNCRAVCGPRDGMRIRSWNPSESLLDLSKRWDQNWPMSGNAQQLNEARDGWMQAAFRNLGPDEEVVPDWAYVGWSTSRTALLGDEKFRLGMGGLCAHYWEGECFGQNKGEKRKKIYLNFNTQVKDFIRDGYKPSAGPWQEGLGKYAADFPDNENLRVVIVSPQARDDERPRWNKRAPTSKNPENLLCPAKVRMMAEIIAEVLGIDVSRVEQKGYYALDDGDPHDHELLDKTAAGNMIFDDDPNAEKRRYPQWRILWERSQVYGDQWQKEVQY